MDTDTQGLRAWVEGGEEWGDNDTYVIALINKEKKLKVNK